MIKRIFTAVILCVICILSAVGFAACDKGGDNSVNDKNYETWKNSDLAEDYNGDRRITEGDYEIYKGYKEWKNSDKAYDYNGDKKINFDDYLFEYNYKPIIGRFKVVNFTYDSDGVVYLNNTYNLDDLAQDIGDFDFEVSNDLTLSCVYGYTVKQKLGDDETAVQDAINSCEFEKLSDYVTTASFTIQGLPFTVYLTKTENGFSSSVDVTVDGVSASITFDITYVE